MREAILHVFAATGSSGVHYTVEAWVLRLTTAEAFDQGDIPVDPSEWRYRTNTGLAARRISKGCYQVIDKEEVLVSAEGP